MYVDSFQGQGCGEGHKLLPVSNGAGRVRYCLLVIFVAVVGDCGDSTKELVTTTIRLPFDCNSTALRPFDDLRYDRAAGL